MGSIFMEILSEILFFRVFFTALDTLASLQIGLAVANSAQIQHIRINLSDTA